MYNHFQISSCAKSERGHLNLPFLHEPMRTVIAALHKWIPAACNHSVTRFGTPPTSWKTPLASFPDRPLTRLPGTVLLKAPSGAPCFTTKLQGPEIVCLLGCWALSGPGERVCNLRISAAHPRTSSEQISVQEALRTNSSCLSPQHKNKETGGNYIKK